MTSTPSFLIVAQRWRWGCELDGHLGKDTHHCKSIHTAIKILQEIHVIKPAVLAWVVNVKYPSLMLLTVHLILKAELIYASMCWEIDAISMILKNHFNNNHHLHV